MASPANWTSKSSALSGQIEYISQPLFGKCKNYCFLLSVIYWGKICSFMSHHDVLFLTACLPRSPLPYHYAHSIMTLEKDTVLHMILLSLRIWVPTGPFVFFLFPIFHIFLPEFSFILMSGALIGRHLKKNNSQEDFC